MKVTIEDGHVDWVADYLRDYVFIDLRLSDDWEWITDGAFWMVLS